MPRNTARGPRPQAHRGRNTQRRGAAGNDPRLEQRRLLVAQEAARLLAQGGLGDYTHAKLKAARRLGYRDEASLPRDGDVEQALLEYRRLFQPDAGDAVHEARHAAVEAMEFLAGFQPRLVGPVLDGTADAATPVSLHLHSEDPDAVPRFLEQHGIPATLTERGVQLDRERRARFPTWQLEAGGAGFELVVLPLAVLRQAPLSPVDRKPMQRAPVARVREMLDAGTDPTDPAG